MVIITGHKKHFLPKYWNRPSPHGTCGGRAPTARFSLQKKMSTYFIFPLDRRPAVHGWRNSLRLRVSRTERDTDKLLAHLNDGADPAQQNPPPLQHFSSELSQYRARGCCGTVDGHHWETRVSGAALREQQRPQYGHRTGKLRSSFVWDHCGTRPAQYRTKCWDLTTTAVKSSPRKTHPGLPQAAGNHVAMPSPCWGCRDIQDAPDVKKNIQRCEWQWGKINAESNSKDLINWMAIKPERFSLGKHQLSVISLGTNCPPVTLPRARRVCWGAHCCQKNSSLFPSFSSSLSSWDIFCYKGSYSKRKYLMWKSYIKREGEMTILLPN